MNLQDKAIYHVSKVTAYRDYAIFAKKEAEEVLSILKNLSEDDYHKNERMQTILLKKLENIGEALYNIPQKIQHEHRGIPFPYMRSLRDALAHNILTNHKQTVWNVVTQHLPVMLPEMDNLILYTSRMHTLIHEQSNTSSPVESAYQTAAKKYLTANPDKIIFRAIDETIADSLRMEGHSTQDINAAIRRLSPPACHQYIPSYTPASEQTNSLDAPFQKEYPYTPENIHYYAKYAQCAVKESLALLEINKNLTLSDYENHDKLYLAIAKKLENIAEALHRLPRQLQDTQKNIFYKQLRSFRQDISHHILENHCQKVYKYNTEVLPVQLQSIKNLAQHIGRLQQIYEYPDPPTTKHIPPVNAYRALAKTYLQNNPGQIITYEVDQEIGKLLLSQNYNKYEVERALKFASPLTSTQQANYPKLTSDLADQAIKKDRSHQKSHTLSHSLTNN